MAGVVNALDRELISMQREVRDESPFRVSPLDHEIKSRRRQLYAKRLEAIRRYQVASKDYEDARKTRSRFPLAWLRMLFSSRATRRLWAEKARKRVKK